MTNPNTCPDPARLRELLDGSIAESEQAELTAHLETCEACQQTVEGLVAGRDSWVGAARQLGAGAAPLDPVLQSAMDQAREAQPHVASEDEVDPHVELPRDFLAPADEPDHLGKLAHYEVFDVVGQGAMGIVLCAFDQKLHRVVAIKVMSPQLASSASARRRFIREGQAAAAVCHEHVVTIHAVEEAHGLPYLVMQYVGGVSLQDRLDASGPLELREILRIGMQAAEGLAAAHAQGLVHRDIKPSNILLENGVERVKITDFGLARAVDDASLTQTGVIAGTPQYMAPEQAHGAALDHRADLFSLGSVLYALCAGRPPFRSSTMMAVLKRVCEETPRPIREINPDTPDWLAAIIAKLHAKNPADRFQSANEVGDLLGQYLAHSQRPDRVTLPQPVSVPQQKSTFPDSSQTDRPAHSTLAGAARRSVMPQYLTRMLVAGFMVIFAAVSAGTGMRGLQLLIPVQLVTAVVLFIAMIHAIVVRLFTGDWHGSLVGLFINPTAAAVAADSRAGSAVLRPPLTLLLIVCLLGAAASFMIPWWVHAFWIHPLMIGRIAAIGWLLLALAFYRSASALRNPHAAKQGSAAKPVTTDMPPQKLTLQRAMMMAVIAVCAVVVLVPIGLGAAIGVAWLSYSRQVVPPQAQVSVPATSGQLGSVPSSFSISLWNGSDIERALLGRWIVVSQESRGAPAPDEERLQWLQFGSVGDTNRFAESSHSGQLTIARYIVEEPRQDRPDANPPADEKWRSNVIITDDTEVELRYGIFRIDGDSLTLCMAPAEDSAPESFRTDAGTSAVLYVLKRDTSSAAKAADEPRNSIAGTWSSNWGDVVFEHEPLRNNAVVRVTGWLIRNSTRTRTRFEGTFDPALGHVVLTFEKDFLPSLAGRGGLKLSGDGAEMVGIHDLSPTSQPDGDTKLYWKLTRKPKRAEVPETGHAQERPE